MKYFLDFEANQFSDKIISIGCVAENGNTYSTLVNPKEPIKKFITDLTGIHDELVSAAPDIETAIKNLYDFIIENKNEEPDFFFVYGHEDFHFLIKAARDLYNSEYFHLSEFTEMLAYSLIDYTEKVNRIFDVKCQIALQKLLNYLNNTEEKQKHDALEDALKLKKLYEKLYYASSEQYKDNPFKLRKAELTYGVKATPKIPKLGTYIAIDVETNADYVFNDVKKLIDLVLKKLPKGTKRDRTHNRIMKAMRTKEKYAGFYFESYCDVKGEI